MNRVLNKLISNAATLAAAFGLIFAIGVGAAVKADSPQASTTIVISQVYGGGGATSGTPTYIADYVELKNISSTPQSLNGLSLTYGSAAGNFASSATNAYALANVTLQPGQYYLVQLGALGTVGAALPVTPDETTTNLSMSAASGKVALVVTATFTGNSCGATATPCTLPSATFIDVVSYGAANNAEGGASTNGGAVLTNVMANVRKANGCTDTDNNNADFDIVTAPVPRNSATTAAPCGSVVPPTVKSRADFDGDGKTDISVFRPSDGNWYLNRSAAGFGVVNFGSSTDVIVPGDYDGDGKADEAVYRSGVWYVQRSTAGFTAFNFGTSGDIPVQGDYDGDGKTDFAVFRPSNGVWYVQRSGSTLTSFNWGINGDIPVVGDFDGDGKADFAVFRSGVWYISKSGGGTTAFSWGLSSDRVVPADYDGDGKTDIAVFRASNATWYIVGSAGNNITLNFGISTDIPVPGDYDGDGKTDIAVFRSGVWYIQRTTAGFIGVNFGNSTDIPVPNKYQPQQ
jgi:Lamin Tail Domain/FG-GAP-like repeat